MTNNVEPPAAPTAAAAPIGNDGVTQANGSSPVSSREAERRVDPPQKVLIEPRGPINPKSAEAAGQVVQLFGAYLEAGKLDDAAKAWSSPDAGLTFARQFRGITHMQIGEPGEIEGAAGSSYMTMPVSFTSGGEPRSAKVVLRRVNDVPGSTEAQRRWHIERIGWDRP